MKIAVIGGTGMIGSRIVAEAANRGHQVTAVSRHAKQRPSAATGDFAPSATENVTPLAADVTDTTVAALLAADHDVVVSAFGPSREPGGDPSTFGATLTELARAVAASRFVVVGGAGSLLVAPGVRLVDTPEFPDEYKAEALAAADSLAALTALTDCGDWTYLSPAPVIAPGDRTGKYNVGQDGPAGAAISAEDFAVALVDEIERPAHNRRRFTVAN